MKAERRMSSRKEVYPLKVSSVATVDTMTKLIRFGIILNASINGFLMLVKREDLIPKSLRNELTLDALIGDAVVIKIEEMNLDLTGVVSRTKFLGKEGYEVAIDYTSDAPEYWRECLMDLLPTPKEFDDLQKGVNNIISIKGGKRER